MLELGRISSIVDSGVKDAVTQQCNLGVDVVAKAVDLLLLLDRRYTESLVCEMNVAAFSSSCLQPETGV